MAPWKVALLLAAPTAAVLVAKTSGSDKSCLSSDLENRVQVQNKLAGQCEDMCKSVGSYPDCQCPAFVAPDATPNVMTWDELLPHMDNLVAWSLEMISGWKKGVAALQKHVVLSALAARTVVTEQSCVAEDMKVRQQFQNKLAGQCEDMCKQVGAYPNCNQCVGFVAPDSTPNVMTWDELLEHMDNLGEWGRSMVKKWHEQKAALVQADSCSSADMQHRVQFQNKLAGACEDMCKDVGAYPKCNQCPAMAPANGSPGVMNWDELLEHMDNLVEWGSGMLKDWHAQASALQKHVVFSAVATKASVTASSCLAADQQVRQQIQNKLAGQCEDMCKSVGSYPNCGQCAGFVTPDGTPNVMTWDELLTRMDDLAHWGREQIKSWKGQAAGGASAIQKSMSAGEACASEDVAHRVELQNKLANVCVDMCKQVGSFPNCAQCPQFVAPDATPNVMTWTELLTHMDNLVEWSHGLIGQWHAGVKTAKLL